jgi:hypothetical protein
MEMKRLILLAALGAAACAHGPTEIRTQEVAVTHVERAITPDQVRAVAPPAPMGPRPSSMSAALDLAIAKLCEYVGYADRADTLLQHAAGMTPVQRVLEPICRPPAPH